MQGNSIGTNAAGTEALGNGLSGITLANSTGNTIGGTAPSVADLISGNSTEGIVVTGAGGNLIQGNDIGTKSNGTAGLGNGFSGISLFDSAGNTIGGTTPGASNLISGNVTSANDPMGSTNRAGITLSGMDTKNNVVQGNIIGPDATGTAVLVGGMQRGNSKGIDIDNQASGNTIGGSDPGARNIISGNTFDGVLLKGSATGNLVLGNYIGTDRNGTAFLGNGTNGVTISDASNNTIGGTTAEARNVISGNDGFGISITGVSGPTNTTNNTVQGNFIGTDVTGTKALGNANHGVIVQFGASSNTIGGTAGGAGNTIAFNGGSGVVVGLSATDSSVGNAILSNSIFSNAGLGIDLGNDDVTPNDQNDADTGPNNLQNFPVLTSVASTGSSTIVTGTLSTTPNPSVPVTYRIEFFANAVADPSGFGEGQTFLGFATVAIGSSGTADFTSPALPPVPSDQFITATATDLLTGNTSEFSPDISSGTTVTNTNDSGPGSLRQAILNANATPGVQTITFAIPGAGVHTISPTSPLPAITDPVIIDAPPSTGTAPIELDGSNFPNVPLPTNCADTPGLLDIEAKNSTIRGLTIRGFNGFGIVLGAKSGNTVVAGDNFGTNSTGTAVIRGERRGRRAGSLGQQHARGEKSPGSERVRRQRLRHLSLRQRRNGQHLDR